MNEQVKTIARFAGVTVFGGAALMFLVYGVAMFVGSTQPQYETPSGFFFVFGVIGVALALVAGLAAAACVRKRERAATVFLASPGGLIVTIVLIWIGVMVLREGSPLGVLAIAGAGAGLAALAVRLVPNGDGRSAHA